jgi:hypothetical protein
MGRGSMTVSSIPQLTFWSMARALSLPDAARDHLTKVGELISRPASSSARVSTSVSGCAQASSQFDDVAVKLQVQCREPVMVQTEHHINP